MEKQINAVAEQVPELPANYEEVSTGVQKLPIAALSDWVHLLQGPAANWTEEECKFNQEWKRLFRLVSLVLLMFGAVVTVFSVGLGATGGDWKKFASNSSYLFLTLVIGAALSVPYAFVLAPLMRIRISFSQTFFSILLLGLPWLPLIALIWAVGKVWTTGLAGLGVITFLYILGIVPLLNFSKAVARISSCKLWRVLISLLVPALLALMVFVANFVWEF